MSIEKLFERIEERRGDVVHPRGVDVHDVVPILIRALSGDGGPADDARIVDQN